MVFLNLLFFLLIQNSLQVILFYFTYLFILSLMLTITEQILFTIRNSNKMLIEVNTLVKKLKTYHILYKKNPTKILIYNIAVKQNI